MSALRAAVQVPLVARDPAAARAVVRERAQVSEEVADQVVTYLAAGLAALGTLPTQDHIVIERFFDEVEGTQLIIHAPFGGRINRAFGLALRKRFCVSFDFELQAAADDDTVAISLGPQHSFPLDQVPKMLNSRTARDVLVQAVLPHPMLQSRWRWNLNRALVVPRSRAGQRRPIHLQRMEADDLLAAAWPALAACQENAPPGPVAVPDHVLVRQTVDDCLFEPLDADGLVALLGQIEAGAIETHLVESVYPSPLAHGILTGRPYTFLDDAPLEERRSRAVPLRRGLGDGGLPVAVDELGPLDGPAVDEVLDQVAPRPRSADELHELLLSLVLARPVPAWQTLFDDLVADGRAASVGESWAATERLDWARRIADDDEVTAECVGGHLALSGPVSEEELASDGPIGAGAPNGVPLSLGRVRSGLARLEGAGIAMHLPDGRWCARHLLVRLHAASRRRRRSAVEPASLADFVRFLTRWQHATEDTRLSGRSGVLAVIEQLAGVEIPAGEWESHVLPARVLDYEPRWLDELCLSGEVAWGRLTRGPSEPPRWRARRRRRGGAGRPRRGPRRSRSCPERTWVGSWPRCGQGSAAPTPTWGPRRTCWRSCANGAPASVRSSRGPQADCRPRSTTGCGTSWRAASSRPTHSRPCVRCSRPGTAGRPGSAVRSSDASAWRGGVPRSAAVSGRAVGRSSPTTQWRPSRPPAWRRRSRSWPRPSPGSCSRAGGSWRGSSGRASPSGRRGEKSSGRCAAWRPGAWRWAAASSPGWPASSMPSPRRRSCWAACGGAPTPKRWRWPPPTR